MGYSPVVQSIWEHINKASMVVAECTGRNPNVFYELGIAHTLGKPVFICTQKKADIPFDIARIRYCMYGQPMPSNLGKLKTRLVQFIDSP